MNKISQHAVASESTFLVRHSHQHPRESSFLIIWNFPASACGRLKTENRTLNSSPIPKTRKFPIQTSAFVTQVHRSHPAVLWCPKMPSMAQPSGGQKEALGFSTDTAVDCWLHPAYQIVNQVLLGIYNNMKKCTCHFLDAVGCWLPNSPNDMLVYLRGWPGLTILRAATLGLKLQIKLST